MGSLFTELNGHVTQEQIKQINKTGIVPPDAKSPEEKKYFIIFKSYLIDLRSQLADNEMTISGEAFIVYGRYHAFVSIKSYLDEDAERAVDVRESIVMVEGVDAGKGISLYRFLKLCNKAYPNEAFDDDTLEQYLEGFNNEEEFRAENSDAVGNGNFGGTFLKED